MMRVNVYESEYPKCNKCGNLNESEKVQIKKFMCNFFLL